VAEAPAAGEAEAFGQFEDEGGEQGEGIPVGTADDQGAPPVHGGVAGDVGPDVALGGVHQADECPEAEDQAPLHPAAARQGDVARGWGGRAGGGGPGTEQGGGAPPVPRSSHSPAANATT